MTKILLLGPNGQVGWELRRSLAPLGDVVALDRHAAGGDLSQPQEVHDAILQLHPDVVVNAAAYTAVDKAETDRDLAFAINAKGPAAIANAAGTVGALLVHYSTDYVFDGSGTTPWREDDPTNPLSVYGASKLEGESEIRLHCERHLILRTSWVYAALGANFAKTMLRLAQERDSLKVIDDQFGAPTGAELLADVTAYSIRSVLSQPEHESRLLGTYHVAASGETSWHRYAKFVLEEAPTLGLQLKVAPESVDAIPTSAYPTPAKRPANSRLNTAKFQHAFGLKLPPWQTGVSRMLSEILRP